MPTNPADFTASKYGRGNCPKCGRSISLTKDGLHSSPRRQGHRYLAADELLGVQPEPGGQGGKHRWRLTPDCRPTTPSTATSGHTPGRLSTTRTPGAAFMPPSTGLGSVTRSTPRPANRYRKRRPCGQTCPADAVTPTAGCSAVRRTVEVAVADWVGVILILVPGALFFGLLCIGDDEA